MSNSVFVEFRLMSSVASKWCPFRTFVSLGNRKKSHGARAGEYGSCCDWAVPCLAKNSCTRCEVCAGALSWCRTQSPSRHLFRSFSFKTASHEPTEIPQPFAISRTVNLLLLRTTVLTLTIISTFRDVDGRPEQGGSLSTEFLTSLTFRHHSSYI